MHGSTVFLVAFFTSVLSAGATVYGIERLGLLKHEVPPPNTDVITPDLRGFSEADARANAQAVHLTLIVGTREPSKEAKPGSVLRQSLPPGQRVPRDYALSVVLAEELPRLPSLVGLSVADASRRLEDKGYKLQASTPVADANVPAGQILSQDPPADTPAEKGRSVSVQVSAGRAEVIVPKLLGVSINNAKAALEKLGLEPAVRWVALAETPTFVVLNQKPKADEKVKPGSKVELTANQ